MWKQGIVSIPQATLALVLATACLLSCGADGRRAEFKTASDGAIIALEIVPIHPVYAEYNRWVRVLKHGKEVGSQTLFPDSGGYASTNLYWCSGDVYWLLGYFDSWVVNVSQGTIVEGQCERGVQQYVGMFDGGGSRQWKFYAASERKETKLVRRED